MAGDARPQIYLVTPPAFDAAAFPDLLGRVLDAVEVACLRIALASRDARAVAQAADLCRDAAHARDVAVVIESHLALVAPHGLDGVHLPDGPRGVRDARKMLGADAIVGASCGASRHDGMNAGEAGADYVCFGPVGDSPLGAGPRAERELFEWWSEVIEVPVVAEGGLDPGLVRELAPVTDFFALGEEIWAEEDPAAALARFAAAIA